MAKVFSRGWLIALLLVAAFAVPGSVLANHSWGGYHWARTANPLNLKLGNNLSTGWQNGNGTTCSGAPCYLGTTSSDWSTPIFSGMPDVINTTIVPGSTTARRCRATSGRVEVCNAAYGNNGWLGIASIWISGGHITQGTVKVNDTYFNTATYNTPAWRNLVMCQEVAHTFGLDHQDENFSNANLNTCMDYTSNPESNQHPNEHDYVELGFIYGHNDSTTTVKQTVNSGKMPPAMADLDIEGPGQWGKLIHSSHGGWKETYELDFGGGHKIITHVLWAIGEDDHDHHDHEHGRQ